jgi:hypothetical protein
MCRKASSWSEAMSSTRGIVSSHCPGVAERGRKGMWRGTGTGTRDVPGPKLPASGRRLTVTRQLAVGTFQGFS